MKYLGSITDDKDQVTKKYVDDASAVVQTLTTGTKIGSVGGTNLYAPSGGGGGGLSFDDIYPVGSIYMSVNSTSPQTLFGGTWQQIQGRFLVGAGDNGASGDEALNPTAGGTGGKASVKLTGAQSGVPAHSHGFTKPTVTTPKLTADNSNYITSATAVTSLRANISSSSSSSYNYVRVANSGASMSKSAPEVASGKSCTVTGGSVSDNTAADASASHENLPPYLAVYIWKRTA